MSWNLKLVHPTLAYYFINDTIADSGKITWETNDQLIRGTVIPVMNAEILPQVGVEGVFSDTLYLFTLNATGVSYVFSRK